MCLNNITYASKNLFTSTCELWCRIFFCPTGGNCLSKCLPFFLFVKLMTLLPMQKAVSKKSRKLSTCLIKWFVEGPLLFAKWLIMCQLSCITNPYSLETRQIMESSWGCVQQSVSKIFLWCDSNMYNIYRYIMLCHSKWLCCICVCHLREMPAACLHVTLLRCNWNLISGGH